MKRLLASNRLRADVVIARRVDDDDDDDDDDDARARLANTRNATSMRAGATTRAATAAAEATTRAKKKTKVSTTPSETTPATTTMNDDDAPAPCEYTTRKTGGVACGCLYKAIAAAHANCCERLYREREASHRANANAAPSWHHPSTLKDWNRNVLRAECDDFTKIIKVMEWLKSRDAYHPVEIMEEAVKDYNVECVTWLFGDRGAEFWKTHPVLSTTTILRRMCQTYSYTINDEKVLDLFRFLKAQGANVDSGLMDLAFTGHPRSRCVIEFCHECGLLTNIEQYRLLDAARHATLDVVRYLKEHCAVEFNQSHVEAGISALRVETVKYLIDSGVYANIDALVAELASTMEQEETLDWQDEDPHEVRSLHDQLRAFFREKLGITPEKDRLRLRVILSCVDSCRETMQSAEYLDICQYLKRLHREAGKL